METIIMNKSHYPVIENDLKKKIILYDNEYKMLVFVDNQFIKLPKNEYLQNRTIEQGIEQVLPINYEENKMIPLITIVNYYTKFSEYNSKLTKVNRKKICEYYTYNIEFEQDLINKILCSEYVKEEQFLPYLIYIKEFLELNLVLQEEDKEAIKILTKKLNYEII